METHLYSSQKTVNISNPQNVILTTINQKFNIKWLLIFAGMDEKNKPFIDMEKALKDNKRISFHRDYLSNLSAAIR